MSVSSVAEVPDCGICFCPLSDTSREGKYAVLHRRTQGTIEDLHQYHWDCIGEWFSTCAQEQRPWSCPLCRAELIPKGSVKFGVVFQNGFPVLILNMPAVKEHFNFDYHYLCLIWDLVLVCIADDFYESPMTLLDFIGGVFLHHYVTRPIAVFAVYAVFFIVGRGHRGPYSFQTWTEFHCRFLLQLGYSAMTYGVFFLLSYAISDTKTKNIFGIVLSYAIANAFSRYSWKMRDEMTPQLAFEKASRDNDFQKYFDCPSIQVTR